MMQQRTSAELDRFGDYILTWSRFNPRPMPWKNFSDPYSIWIAEIILQQTRVEQGWAYFEKFIETFPDLDTLADASLEDVMLVWEGLGYYSRARSLHHTARHVRDELDGRFPDNASDLTKLKGIGPYTSAAIASFAFGERIGVVDGNVKRVVSRYFGIAEDVGRPSVQRYIQELVNEVVQIHPPADFNQAIMNFGSLACTPRNPRCEVCPAALSCQAYQMDMVDQLPIKARSREKQTRWLNFGVYVRDGRIAVIQNKDSTVWQNLYLFPLVGKLDNFKLAMKSKQRDKSPPFPLIDQMEWILSHRKLILHFYHVTASLPEWELDENIEFVKLKKMDNFAFPRPIRLFINQNSRKLGINQSHD